MFFFSPTTSLTVLGWEETWNWVRFSFWLTAAQVYCLADNEKLESNKKMIHAPHPLPTHPPLFLRTGFGSQVVTPRTANSPHYSIFQRGLLLVSPKSYCSHSADTGACLLVVRPLPLSSGYWQSKWTPQNKRTRDCCCCCSQWLIRASWNRRLQLGSSLLSDQLLSTGALMRKNHHPVPMWKENTTKTKQWRLF